jgi:hypothetical protein
VPQILETRGENDQSGFLRETINTSDTSAARIPLRSAHDLSQVVG